MSERSESSNGRFTISESDTMPVRGSVGVESHDWLTGKHEQLKAGVKPIIEDLAELLKANNAVWLLIDGPQGIGKTRYIEPVFREALEQTIGYPSEGICTNLTLIPRDVRNNLPPEQYKDLWNWFNYKKLAGMVNDVVKAQKSGKNAVEVVNWYNRAKGGTHDPAPLSIAVKPLMVLEGIGALSDDVVATLRKNNIPFVGVLFDAPQETRFGGLLSVRNYRTPEEQLEMMNVVDRSYYEHQPKLYTNAGYYGFLSKTGFWVSKLGGK